MYPRSLAIPDQYETGRLLVRAYRLDDAPWYFAMSQRNKAHLARFESGNAVMGINTPADAENVMREFVEDWAARKAFFLGAFWKDSGEFTAQIYIGVVGWGLPELELGYFAEQAHEGRGCVSEAAAGALRLCFGPLGAHRVRLMCDDTNPRSFRVAERCGMLREGHLREDKKHADGSITGTYLYGLLRSEFQAR